MAVGLDAILKAADLIGDVRRAFGRIEALEQSHRQITELAVQIDRVAARSGAAAPRLPDARPD